MINSVNALLFMVKTKLVVFTILFIIFKMLKIIDWSWFGVLAPLYVPLLLIIIVILIEYIPQKFNNIKQNIRKHLKSSNKC